jgi:hypothetical protein
MRTIRVAWIPVILLVASVAYGQINEAEYFPNKDLIFPQVVAGGEYQTDLTVTNRGTEAWEGTLTFYRRKGEIWNPYVNEVQIADGAISAAIPSKATRTYKVTLPGSAEVGYLIAKKKENPSIDNSLQGHLTYYIRNGEQISDSIGVLPSNPFFAATVPFEDFNSICFAFVNTNVDGARATVTFRLYSDTNETMGTYTLPLAGKEHAAMYLWQMFNGVTIGRGRVEIGVDVPISGIALIQVAGGQYSSIPLTSTYRHYHITYAGISEITFKELTLWTEGLFIHGYAVAAPPVTKELGPTGSDAVFAIFGHFRNGKPILHIDGNSAYSYNYEFVGYFLPDTEFWPFSTPWTGVLYAWLPIEERDGRIAFSATLVQ